MAASSSAFNSLGPVPLPQDSNGNRDTAATPKPSNTGHTSCAVDRAHSVMSIEGPPSPKKTLQKREVLRLLETFIADHYHSLNWRHCIENSLTFPAPFEVLGKGFRTTAQNILACTLANPKLDVYPVCSVVSPPTHGKSLLLDLIAEALLNGKSSTYVPVRLPFSDFKADANSIDTVGATVIFRILHHLTPPGLFPSYQAFLESVVPPNSIVDADLCLQDLYLLLADTRAALPPRIVLVLMADDVTCEKLVTKLVKLAAAAPIIVAGQFDENDVLCAIKASGFIGYPRICREHLTPADFEHDSIRLGQRIKALSWYLGIEFDEVRWQASKSFPAVLGFWIESLIRDGCADRLPPLCEVLLQGDPMVGWHVVQCLTAEHTVPTIDMAIRKKYLFRLPQEWTLAPVLAFLARESWLQPVSSAEMHPFRQHVLAAVRAPSERGTDVDVRTKRFITHAFAARIWLQPKLRLSDVLGCLTREEVTMWRHSMRTAVNGVKTWIDTLFIDVSRPESVRQLVGDPLFDVLPVDVPPEFTLPAEHRVSVEAAPSPRVLKSETSTWHEHQLRWWLADDCTQAELDRVEEAVGETRAHTEGVVCDLHHPMTRAALVQLATMSSLEAETVLRAAFGDLKSSQPWTQSLKANCTEIESRFRPIGARMRHAVVVGVPHKLFRLSRAEVEEVLDLPLAARLVESDFHTLPNPEHAIRSRSDFFTTSTPGQCAMTPTKGLVDAWIKLDTEDQNSFGMKLNYLPPAGAPKAVAVHLRNRNHMSKNDFVHITQDLVNECILEHTRNGNFAGQPKLRIVVIAGSSNENMDLQTANEPIEDDPWSPRAD